MEEKIDILFYLFGTCMVFWLVRTAFALKKLLFPRVNERFIKRINDWDSKAEYNSILENVDSFIKMFPGESDFVWAKARALYKVGEHDKALELFEALSKSEPSWKESADSYINSIKEQRDA
ncbi:hypothetical protein DXV75_16780 [Alteromonas aestuariivivens]|uniref:Tetratricopeptide repeat protein n=1 Tax=Alteromonas aestuariivivens TaxID=1938339 RepID=A0A3D8M2Q5_9ALTE|nr:hypothetical protein [Alteromonas aestuariivivens]RDV23896.1 hypothetical protein DXV75_16780 [Alteromonas aestuariivivens]